MTINNIHVQTKTESVQCLSAKYHDNDCATEQLS